MTSSEQTPQSRARLAKLLDERRAELRLRWRDVAEQAGITVEGLRTLRIGTGRIRSTTKRGLEDALRWRPGSIDRILADGDPEPMPSGRGEIRAEPGHAAEGAASVKLPLRVQGELADRKVLDHEVVDLAWTGSKHKLIVLWAGPADESEDIQGVRREYAAWMRGRRQLGEVFADPPEES